MNLDPDNVLKKDFSDLYHNAYAGWQNYLREAVTDMEVHLGAQFTPEEQEWAEANDRLLYPFGKSARQVELLSGYEIRNRHMLKIGPIGRSDDEACQQHTSVILWQMGAYGGYTTLSQAFKWGTLVTGSNLMELWRDRDGNIRFGRRSFNTFLLDPALSASDLSDCGYIVMGRWLDEGRIKVLLPQVADDIAEIPHIRGSMRWSLAPNAAKTDKDKQRLFEEWYRPETKFVPSVISRLSGTDVPIADLVRASQGRLDERQVQYFIDNARMPNGAPMFSRFSKPVDEIRLTLFVDNEPVYDGAQSLKMNEYPFIWLHGEWMPECDRDELKLQSFTRGLRPTTRARNRRINQILDIIERQIQNVRLFRQNSLVDKEDAYRSGQTHPIEISENAQGSLSEHFWQMPAPDIPSGLFAICELLEREETHVKGLNEEIFGSDDKENVPGILARFRTGQALTGQQGIFDGFRESKRSLGRKLVKVNQQHLDERRVQRIIERMPVPQFYEADFAKYDCTPVEAALTPDQQVAEFRQMVELIQVFPKLAELTPPSMIVQMAPIVLKKEYMQVLQRAEQQSQQMASMQMKNQQILNDLILSERQQNIARAQSDRAGAMLDAAKTATEIQNLRQEPNLERMDRLLRLLEIQQKAAQARLQAARTPHGNGGK